ncbi:hypothetical protein [Salinimicrobium sp. TH3]|uniref:hypothetical protein n=1 Tax=Salinimicrobium sp. TH3 TaxID=2997342 RepID=UPI00227558BB|nr:hypothetical protein [Salinimicrobium sp. TH3]MCY2687147.1 hypothetical protein [Salinimicrobium sp. TH3]
MAIIFCSAGTFAQQTYSEQQILQKLDSIHSSPFSEEIKETSAQTLLWIQKDSGIEVMDIGLFVNALKISNRELAPYLIRSYFFGKVAYILENETSEDDVAAKAAGLQNLIKVYEQFLEKNPKAANPEADKLASLQGPELKEYIQSFENRDGLSYETAVVRKSIIEEYQWMKEHYPNAEMLGKSLIPHEGRTYDVFEIQLNNEEKFKLYFDTSIIL